MAPKNLLAKQRHDVILESIRKEGSARVSELAERFDVSEMTVRRDLALLAEQNLIDKVHGGATRTGGSSAVEPGFEIKRAQQRAEKSAIAKAAADMVKPGAAIGLTAGTTTWRMAQLVTHIPDLTVVTNSPTIASTSTQPAAENGPALS